MEEQLRKSAAFWRGIAGVTMVLGIIGSIVIAVVVARDPFGDEFDAGVFFTILIPSILGLMLSLGFFFIGTRIMDGIAELIALNRPARGSTPATSSTVGAASTVPQLPDVSHTVREPGVKLRSTAGDVLTHLPPGTRVAVSERWGAQVKVTTEEGLTGWVAEHLLQPAESPPPPPA